MNFGNSKKTIQIIILFTAIVSFLGSNYCVHSLFAEEQVMGVKLSADKKYQTSLGQLNHGFLLQNDNKSTIDASGKLFIYFGFIHIGSDEAIEINDNLEVFQGETNLSPRITIVKDKKSGKWLATNGTMCIQNNSTMLLDNTTIKVIGGMDKPIKIAGQTFVDTTVLIKNRKPYGMNSKESNINTVSLLNDKKEDVVYTLIDDIQLHLNPELSKIDGPAVPFGQSLQILDTKEDWMFVEVTDTDKKGWVHRGTITHSAKQVDEMKRIGAVPTNILYIFNIKDPGSFEVAILAGNIRAGQKRVLAEHGNCVVFADDGTLFKNSTISMQGLGVQQSIVSPKPWTLYYYHSEEKKFRSILDLVSEGKPISKGQPRPGEPVEVGVAKMPSVNNWPAYKGELSGRNPVRINNPNEFTVKVGLRSGGMGKDFTVPPNGIQTMYVPDGHYNIYFQYSNEPDSLYQGDSFKLNGNGVEIQIVKIVNGNYGIRKIK